MSKAKTKRKPTVKRKSALALKKGRRRLRIGTAAYLKFLVLHNNTTVEWSGYGPLAVAGKNYELLDFYYLSSGDTSSSTTLEPEATAEAWTRVARGGYDLDNVRLAWVHCHPSVGMGSWSWQDDEAIGGLVKFADEQVSVLFNGTVSARYDTKKLSETMIVDIDYGVYVDDVEKAVALEREFEVKRTAAYKKPPMVLIPEYAHLFDGFEEFEEEEDEEMNVAWQFQCEVCLEIVTQRTRPKTCLMCCGEVCEACMDKKYTKLCVADACGLDQLEAYAQTLGKWDSCLLCGVHTGGEVYCDDCKPIFEDVES